MTVVHTVHVAEDFSRYPAGRWCSDGPFSGQAFCELFAPMVAKFDRVIFDLDRTSGLPASFLEQAFGGLVRAAPSFALSPSEMASRIELVSKDHPAYERLARQMIHAAVKQGG